MDLFTELQTGDELNLSYPHRRLGILGGTFNPIHSGHIDMALRVREEMALDEVVLVPAGMPPHKNDEKIAPAHCRLHMVALCALCNSELSADDLEMKRDGPSFTVDTLKALHRKHPDTDFYFIIGSDSLFELESWKDFTELCSLTSFACIPRFHHESLQMTAKALHLRQTYDANIYITNYTGLPISSSDIREKIAKGQSITGLVPPYVEEYIIESGLYK